MGVDFPVRITAHPFTVRHARLINMSVSGASLTPDLALRVLSRIQVVIETPHTVRSEAPAVAAYVVRSDKHGIGIEWCEFAPPVVSELLAALASRRYVRVRRPPSRATVTIARLSPPLLKHGSYAAVTPEEQTAEGGPPEGRPPEFLHLATAANPV